MLPDAVKTEQDPEEAEPQPAPRGGRRRAFAWQMPAALLVVLIAAIGLCQLTGLAKRLRPLPTATPAPTATVAPTATDA